MQSSEATGVTLESVQLTNPGILKFVKVLPETVLGEAPEALVDPADGVDVADDPVVDVVVVVGKSCALTEETAANKHSDNGASELKRSLIASPK